MRSRAGALALLVLFPALAGATDRASVWLDLGGQLNGKYTSSWMLGAEFLAPVGPVSVRGGLQGPLFGGDTDFARALLDVQREARATERVRQGLTGWVAVDFAPLSGEMATEVTGVAFEGYVSLGLGVTNALVSHTRALRDDTWPLVGQGVWLGEPFYDAGLRPLGLGALGLRMNTSGLAFRMELRTTVMSNALTTLNGCTAEQLGPTPPAAGCDLGLTPEGSARSYYAYYMLRDEDDPGLTWTTSFAIAVGWPF